jgi:hypothetical protein
MFKEKLTAQLIHSMRSKQAFALKSELDRFVQSHADLLATSAFKTFSD